MSYNFDMSSLPFRQLFATLFVLFIGFFAAAALQAWTGPTATAPNSNVSAPINTSTTDQVKDAGLSLNALAVFGSQYIQDKLGIGRVSPVTALDVNGSLRLADGGEVCQAVTEGGIRYSASATTPEYCDGETWRGFGGVGGAPQSANFTSSGSFTVPSDYSVIMVMVSGAGGGGGAPGPGKRGQGSTGYAGESSRFESFESVIAYGGGAGNANGADGAAGGGVGEFVVSGFGADGGSGFATAVCPWNGGSGGQGGRVTQSYTPSTLQGGSVVAVIVGIGGAGGPNVGCGPGRTGTSGRVDVYWW